VVEAKRKPPEQIKKELHPEGVQELQAEYPASLSHSATPSGCGLPPALAGGLRFAPTTGYFLATLRVGLLQVKLEST